MSIILSEYIVVPVHKKGNSSEVSNHRSIAILSVLYKVLEKVVFKWILSNFSKFNIINKVQHGFNVCYSTQTTAHKFGESVFECLDLNLHVRLFLFLCAFDTLVFQFIIDKCVKLGFRGIFSDWLRSFVHDRTKAVKNDEIFSSDYMLVWIWASP